MEANFNLSGHLATRERVNCPTLVKIREAAEVAGHESEEAEREKFTPPVNCTISDGARRRLRAVRTEEFRETMTEVETKISKLGE
jgi:hypothetical protein